MGGPQYDKNFGGYRVFCGDLGKWWNWEINQKINYFFLVGSRTNKFELEKEFDSFGPLVDCWVARNPPGFAFIVYKHADDAERAVEELDGR
jgi:RNA recognition motif-containing protein